MTLPLQKLCELCAQKNALKLDGISVLSSPLNCDGGDRGVEKNDEKVHSIVRFNKKKVLKERRPLLS